MPFLAITSFGYALAALLLLCIYIAYKWLQKGTKQKSGCFSIGLVTIIVFFVLCFPLLISFSLFQEGNDTTKVAVVATWIGVFIIFLVAKITKKTDKLWSIVGTFFKYVFFIIFSGLFLTLYLGMFYFVYELLFTNNKTDAPIWAGFICVLFTSVLTLIIALMPIANYKNNDKKSTFYDLKKALKKPELVSRLDLSEQNLTVFPMEILSMTNLQFLDLSSNNISQIPLDVKKLSKLKEFVLKRNPIPVGTKVSLRKEFETILISF